MFSRMTVMLYLLCAISISIIWVVPLDCASAAHSSTGSSHIPSDVHLSRDDIMFYLHQRSKDPTYETSHKSELKRRISIENTIEMTGDGIIPLLCEIWDDTNTKQEEYREITSLALKLNGDVSDLVPKVYQRLKSESEDMRFIISAIDLFGKHGRENEIDYLASMLTQQLNAGKFAGTIHEEIIAVLAERGFERHIAILENFAIEMDGGNPRMHAICRNAIGRVKLRSLERKLKEEKTDRVRRTLEHEIAELRAQYAPVRKIETGMTLDKLMYGENAAQKPAESQSLGQAEKIENSHSPGAE